MYGRPLRPVRVLVADDNADATNSLAVLLRTVGCDVGVAYVGLAVVPVAVEFRPDVCVLDIGMPGLSGWDVARQMRDRVGGEKLLLIAVTGSATPDDLARSADAGFDHHILKPADPQDIFYDIAAFIRRSLLAPV